MAISSYESSFNRSSARQQLQDIAYRFLHDNNLYHRGGGYENQLIEMFADYVAKYAENGALDYGPKPHDYSGVLSEMMKILEAEEGEAMLDTAHNRMNEIRADKSIIRQQQDVIKDLTEKLEKITKQHVDCSWVRGGDKLLCVVHDKDDLSDTDDPEQAYHD